MFLTNNMRKMKLENFVFVYVEQIFQILSLIHSVFNFLHPYISPFGKLNCRICVQKQSLQARSNTCYFFRGAASQYLELPVLPVSYMKATFTDPFLRPDALLVNRLAAISNIPKKLLAKLNKAIFPLVTC